KEEIDLATRLDFQNEVVNGEVYKRALLVSYALFPIKPGKAIIDPYKAKCAVMVSSGFGFGRQYYFTKASKPLDIEVLPIPAEGRPPDYAGAVGKFSVRAEISEKSVPVNQPITLKVRFDGKGNGKLITLPKLNLPPTVEIYDTKTESKFFKNGQSYKEFEVLLIPREAGELRIPPLTFSLFDPTLGQFYQQVTPELSMIVTPASADQTIASTPLENVQDKEADLETKQAPTLPELALGWDGTWNFPISGWPLWISLYLGTFLLLTGWAVFQFGLWPRGRDVQKLYRERIQKVQRLAEKGEWRLVGVEGINTVYFVLGEVTGVGGGSQELEQLILKAPPSVRREVEGPLRKIMLAFEALGFAPEELVGALKEKSELKRLAKELNDLLSRSLDLAVSSVSDANTSTANMETKT
ncbi:MAG: BatD family protein, partial [Bdellovibrionales bacterium]|nr:BatD family protein [Bdellovibrionales bacterium]